MRAAESKSREYYVKTPEGVELGPLSMVEVRRALMLSGDPNPDYEVQCRGDGRCLRASQFPELADMFDAGPVSAGSTKDETPSAKMRRSR